MKNDLVCQLNFYRTHKKIVDRKLSCCYTVFKLTKKESALCKKQLRYYLLIIGGGGTS
jgi:hypothetical protein